MTRTRRHDVAIHAPLASPLYARGRATLSGGAELQMFYLARELASRGLNVCHILSPEAGLPATNFARAFSR